MPNPFDQSAHEEAARDRIREITPIRLPDQRILKAMATWQRSRMECPYCAECNKQLAHLTGVIAPVLVKSEDEWRSIHGEAIQAFFDVYRKVLGV
jgi:hypothetical protein